MGVPPVHRSSQVALYRNRIRKLDTSRQWDPKELRALWAANGSNEEKR
jgi:hypothetical protein